MIEKGTNWREAINLEIEMMGRRSLLLSKAAECVEASLLE
jgi:hypothetical protein